MVRFELTASTSRTWRANRAALHPELGVSVRVGVSVCGGMSVRVGVQN